MKVYDEKFIESVYDLDELCWSGARDRVLEVEELDDDKQEKFLNHVLNYIREEEDNCQVVTTTMVNDFIWFECDGYISKLKSGIEED